MYNLYALLCTYCFVHTVKAQLLSVNHHALSTCVLTDQELVDSESGYAIRPPQSTGGRSTDVDSCPYLAVRCICCILGYADAYVYAYLEIMTLCQKHLTPSIGAYLLEQQLWQISS